MREGPVWVNGVQLLLQGSARADTSSPLAIPLPLAVEDLVPTALSSLGLRSVVRVANTNSAAAGRIAGVGAALVAAGGAARGSWKVVRAAGGPDIEPLHAALFPLLGPGFGLLAIALAAASAPKDSPLASCAGLLTAVTLASGASLGGRVVLGTGTRRTELALVAATTAGNTIAGVLLVRSAARARLQWAAAGFAANLATAYLLAGLARLGNQSVAVQAAEQAANTASQAVFFAAARRLERAGRACPREAG